MAKKRKKSSGRKKYRRMGAASFTAKLKKNEDTLILGAGVVVGIVAKGFIDNIISKPEVQEKIKINQNLVDGVQFGAGVAGVMLLDGAFLKGLSIGVGAAGAASGLRTLGVIKGANLTLVPFRPRPRQARTSMNGGNTHMQSVAGGSNSYGFPSPPGVGRTLRRKMGSY